MDALASAYMEFRHLTNLKNDIKGIDNMIERAIFNYILEREITFRRDDVRFVLDQHSKLDFIVLSH